MGTTLGEISRGVKAWRHRFLGPKHLLICVVDCSAPTANFSADVTSGDAPLWVTFSDDSTDSPTSWLWDFGETGATSTDQNPACDYTEE